MISTLATQKLDANQLPRVADPTYNHAQQGPEQYTNIVLEDALSRHQYNPPPAEQLVVGTAEPPVNPNPAEVDPRDTEQGRAKLACKNANRLKDVSVYQYQRQ